MVNAEVIDKKGTVVTIMVLPEYKQERAFEMVLDLEKEEVLKNDSKEVACSPSLDYMPGLMNPYAMHASYEMFVKYRETGKIPENIAVAWY